MNAKKLVIIGDTSVGKTSILQRFVFNKFDFESMPTLSGAFKTKDVNFDDGKGNNVALKMQIWDTAGQERFDALTKMYFNGASAALIVYDVTDNLSFEKARKWVNDLSEQDSNS